MMKKIIFYYKNLNKMLRKERKMLECLRLIKDSLLKTSNSLEEEVD